MAPTGIKPPAAFDSVQGLYGKSMVFYVDKEDNIKAWRQNPDEEGESLYKNAPKNPSERQKPLVKDSKLWNRKEYDNKGVASKESKVIATSSGDLSVVSLTSGDKKSYQIRIYYASEAKDGVSYLSELCMDMEPGTFAPQNQSKVEGTTEGRWFKGALDNAEFQIAPDSPISAHVINGAKPEDSSIKVYYFPKNPNVEDGYGPAGRPAVAWITLDYKYGWLSTESGI
ncbi:hypothetical protein CB0940_12241 [Cercospora beticola]|uniref:Fucose-specific lectin n=1 Tax=Cercospora beticola TaxID=122368 RepID=A0A2G5H6J2_CERBT|nr:hypothetical protein CB0940_12241 [Cercospora beticola]PIA87873.1 hypothetical protein CB0940_12241 [Cercospora beticola]WPB04513.1 hypothetical protein RHO25_009159 [Cercospora beticola]CAK1364256.1 unnamed protein product [Cercospora beticola]